mmetsp:Transcript_45717/g.141306  ORF Transcript_45717/g.141306 Transcript_45717/m.141306 type:complete len:350 (-) Transcript_45717:943-1992(-)
MRRLFPTPYLLHARHLFRHLRNGQRDSIFGAGKLLPLAHSLLSTPSHLLLHASAHLLLCPPSHLLLHSLMVHRLLDKLLLLLSLLLKSSSLLRLPPPLVLLRTLPCFSLDSHPYLLLNPPLQSLLLLLPLSSLLCTAGLFCKPKLLLLLGAPAALLFDSPLQRLSLRSPLLLRPPGLLLQPLALEFLPAPCFHLALLGLLVGLQPRKLLGLLTPLLLKPPLRQLLLQAPLGLHLRAARLLSELPQLLRLLLPPLVLLPPPGLLLLPAPRLFPRFVVCCCLCPFLHALCLLALGLNFNAVHSMFPRDPCHAQSKQHLVVEPDGHPPGWRALTQKKLVMEAFLHLLELPHQ